MVKPWATIQIVQLVLLLHAAAMNFCLQAAASGSNSISTGFTAIRLPSDKDDFLSDPEPILTSSNGHFSLLLTGCSLVVIRNKKQPISHAEQTPSEEKKVEWLVDYRSCEGTQDESNTLHFREDGELVIYAAITKVSGAIQRWSSGTAFEGAKTLLLSDTGVLQLLDEASSIIWQSSDKSSPSLHVHITGEPDQSLRQLQEVDHRVSQHWYQNYSCIFDNTNSFSYLHVAYVYYFNISNRESFQSPVDSCLDTCTQDCSCAAIVYNVETECCYEFHQYIPVQTLPFNPVQKDDILSVYIKVERGSYSHAPPLLHPSAITVFCMIFLAAHLVF